MFFGSETGNTKEHAFEIQQELLGTHLELQRDPIDLADASVSEMTKYNFIIIGCPTWNIGELQADVEAIYEDLNDLDLNGKRFALYGVGDQEGYPDNYQDALGILAQKIRTLGGQLVGFTPTEGYRFQDSKGVEKGSFLGLALDDDNQKEMSLPRIKNWIKQILIETKN